MEQHDDLASFEPPLAEDNDSASNKNPRLAEDPDSACNKKPRLAEDHDSDSMKKKKMYKEMIEEYRKNLPPGHLPPLTDEEYRIYGKHVQESQGFDVPYFPGRTLVGGISPLVINDAYRKELTEYCKEALGIFNSDKTSNYVFDELVKSMIRPVRGSMFYITFRAKDQDTCETFETRVWRKILKEGIEVKFCRIKCTQ